MSINAQIKLDEDQPSSQFRGTTCLIRKVLNGLYQGCGAIAALFLLGILFIIVAQMIARWIGVQFPGSTNYAGYFMAAASFFALAYTLNHQSHIRVTLFLSKLKGWPRYVADVWCLGIASFLSSYLAYYACKNVYVSHLINDVSQGQDALPLWIPQLPVAIGSTVFAIALFDHFLRTLLFKKDTFIEVDPAEMEVL